MTVVRETPAGAKLVDANMHWLPEDLFSNEELLSAFVDSVQREHGIKAKIVAVPGNPMRQNTIEQPAGYEVLVGEGALD